MDLVGSEGARSPIDIDSGGFCWAPSSSRASPGAGAGGVPWDDERRVLMRRRVSYARRVRPSRPVTRPPSYRVEVSRPARASKTGGLENFSFFYSGAKLFTTKQGCRQVPCGSLDSKRHPTKPACQILASTRVAPAAQFEKGACDHDEPTQRPVFAAPPPSSTLPRLHPTFIARPFPTHPPGSARPPRGTHRSRTSRGARTPVRCFSVEGTRPAKQGFQTPKRTAAYPARAPRVGARRPPNDGADVRQSGVHPRGTSHTFPPRPQLAPARSLSAAPTPKRSPPSKANIPKTKQSQNQK